MDVGCGGIGFGGLSLRSESARNLCYDVEKEFCLFVDEVASVSIALQLLVWLKQKSRNYSHDKTLCSFAAR